MNVVIPASHRNATHTCQLTIGQCAALACLLEVSAPKPGNVHRAADFEDMTLVDFQLSAVAVMPALEGAARGAPVGETVEQAVRATRRLVNKNTNLGTILLLAPLASVPSEQVLDEGIGHVLARLSAADAQCVYRAIRVARPGGLGDVHRYDIASAPPDDLLAAMRDAAPRDLVAQQYANDFADVLGVVACELSDGLDNGWTLSDAIVHAHVRVMSRFPDSLIARKCGQRVAEMAAAQAGAVLESGRPGDERYQRALADLDFWLRADAHRRNPGTTADMITAGLFVLLRAGVLQPPLP